MKSFRQYIVERDMMDLDSKIDIPRHKMPQVASADHDDFLKHMETHGISHSYENPKVSSLKPTQSHFDADKVSKMDIKSAKDPKKRIIVTKDNYIMDGHHRWKKLVDDSKDHAIPAIRLNTDIHKAIKATAKFPQVFYKK